MPFGAFWCFFVLVKSYRKKIKSLKLTNNLIYTTTVENPASLYCENNYDFLKILVEKNYSFLNMLIVDVWQVPEYISDFEYPSALNITGLGSEYACVSKYARVLNMHLVRNMSGF